MTPLLEVTGLHVSIGGVPVLRNVSFQLQPGEVLGLVGESGAGKSMAGRAILNVLPPKATIEAGSIAFNGQELLTMQARVRRMLLGSRFAMIPQDPMTALNPSRPIGAQLCDGLFRHLHLARREAQAKAISLLTDVHIRDPARVLRQYPHELSGGMRQRVLIAMAFSCAPAIIIADEPTTALDVTVQRQILRLIKIMQRDFGTALLFVSHDLGVVSKICDRVCVMHSGRILENAPVSELFNTPRHAYTRALLDATPRYDRPASALKPVSPALAAELSAEAVAFDREARNAR